MKTMSTFGYICGRCKRWTSIPLSGESFSARCRYCAAFTRIELFPALYRGIKPGMAGRPVLEDDESSCFYHPDKKAVSVCRGCGRFLCSLCEVEWGEMLLCPVCIERGAAREASDFAGAGRFHYDSLALALAVYPLLIFYLTIISAPIALYLSVRYWRADMSCLPRGKSRLAAAFVISALQLAGWAVAIGSIFL